ncbi:hypothetical protein FRACYDRAFT_233803 [Fragilariopsis cylindrus CCMP1102]|uniref:Uncharacterized protein n=1 Tax=Fragilariopsis cylindrus CCMP1102 TaxID=635003 RepID=A0A1E7FZP6_9STRA|nr:hypothetical protein FRACYDRAFT_233803 [Fragilariopsis cylindrus CCMP1102]|eukprot:OEU23632.1 hypothetical protein FRACYDRAFT_233803 [Fragilariopsis cylindrus CCMP1102]
MTQNNESSTPPSGTADNKATAATTDTTSGKAAGSKKKQQQKKGNNNNASAKKKQTATPKSSFKGLASGNSSMKGIVIADGNGNKAGQFRVFQKSLAGTAAEAAAYGLDSAILDLEPKLRTDFITPKESPEVHSNLTPILDEDGAETGGNTLVCFNPALKEQMDAEYHTLLKIQSSNWNQYSRIVEGYYRIAIGNIDSNVLTYCRMDKRMADAEKKKDLIAFLLILRSVCAQNQSNVKVDQEFKNLHSLHSTFGYKQVKSVSDADYAEEVMDRYESAVFTCGKFIVGQTIYDKVLSRYHTPCTFKEYHLLTEEKQAPIDDIVKDRTVARLIIKNSLNSKARAELVKTYSVNNSSCYPNTVSEALSLLETFKMTPADNNNTNQTEAETAIVSYHETIDPVIENEVEDIIPNDAPTHEEPTIDDVVVEETEECTDTNQADFNATVMASIISEATAEADEEMFIGASFAGLQDADEAYDDNEPDLLCFAHVVDQAANAEESSSEESNQRRDRILHERPSYAINHKQDFELVVYLTAQRVNNSGDHVRIRHYEVDNPGLISHEYGGTTPEAIVDYSDVLRLKLQTAGIKDVENLLDIFEECSTNDASSSIRHLMNTVCQVPLHTSTVRFLKEETYRHKEHLRYNSTRYDVMCGEIGRDDAPIHYPAAHVLLHHTIVAVASYQQRRKPTRWINKVTRKMTECHINSREQLENVIRNNTINDVFQQYNKPSFHKMTINGFKHILGIEVNQGYIAGYTQDFRQGRS